MNIIDLDLDSTFQDCFTLTAGPVAECYCGREHVCIDSDYFDDDDAEMVADYWKRDETDDTLVIHGDCDTLGQVEIANKSFVEGCECQGWKPYMDFILSHRSEIKDFLIQVASKAQTALEHEKTFNLLKK